MLRKGMMLLLVSCALLYAQVPFTQVIDNADGTQTFDIVISLYHTPDALHRTYYEEVIEHMARTIYEVSNRGHHLGTVRIFQEGRQGAISGIIWNENEWPRASVNGFGTRYGKIWVGDVTEWDNVNRLTASAQTRAGLGYTLGHEWCHYVYSVLDQYRMNAGDIATLPSIMNNQWSADGGNWEWLNFDTPNNFEPNNAHGRAWGVSCWDLVTQPLANDALNGNVTAQPSRTLYNALIGRAPTAAITWTNPNSGTLFEWMDVDLDAPDADPLRDLEIIWMQHGVELNLVIDRSGSMGGTPIANARDAAKQFVTFLPEGNSVLGVTSFSTNGYEQENVAMTAIPDPGDAVVSQFLSDIDLITAGGNTALYDGANFGLSKLDAYNIADPGNTVRAVMLLSDGADNSSTITEQDVIDAYQAAQVPLFTFGYGNGYDHSTLQSLSQETQGRFYPQLTTQADLFDAFIDAVADAAGMQLIPAQWRANAGADFQNDGTFSSIILVLQYFLLDGQSSVEVEIRDETNVLVSPDPDVTYNPLAPPSFPSLQRAEITINSETLMNHPSGTWHLDLVVDGSVQFQNLQIFGTPATKTPELMVENHSGVSVQYPEPLLLTASVLYEKMITGLSIDATLTTPAGTEVAVQLYDDGTHGDKTAEDGIYSNAYTNYSENGEYYLTVLADNEAGTAMYTDKGLAFTKLPDGVTYTPPAPQPMTMRFARMKTIRFTVSGAVADDHGNYTPDATPIPYDNTREAGRIESQGDVDFFEINTSNHQGDLVIRLSDMSSEMQAEMTVFDSDGYTQIGSANAVTGKTANGYIALTINAAEIGSKLFVAVNDLDEYGDGGVYKISAGPQKTGDQPAASIRVYTKDDGIYESNAVKPRMYLVNEGSQPVSDFKVEYYLTAESGNTPVVDDYWTPQCDVEIVYIEGDLYKVVYSFSGVTLGVGETVPGTYGNAVGIHYSNWSAMDKSNDFSNPGTSVFMLNERIAVFSADGILISGSTPVIP